MGDYLSKPVTDKHNEQGSGNNLRYGIASMQGWRTHQEDAHCATIEVSDKLKDWSFFAVFDGHCCESKNGDKISAYCAEHLLESIMNAEEGSSSDFSDRIRSGFLNLDQSMRTVPGIGASDSDCGTTAVCAFITPEKIYIANCGDSRAVLCNSGEPVFGTQDHKPSLKKECERIKRAGGYVNDDRVQGQLAMSRCLGDYKYKAAEDRDQCEQMVSPEPEITVRDRDEKDEFLVIACDGIWDKMKNKDICELIRSRLLVTDDLATIGNEVLDTCLRKSSKDNMSIALVTFPAAPTPSPEAIEKERNLERDIEKLILKIISVPEIIEEEDDKDKDDKYEHVSVQNILCTLNESEKYFPTLPPEGNIGIKRGFIERIFQRCPDRGSMLGILTDKAVDILLDKDGCDIEGLVEQMLVELKENNPPNLPSGDDIDTKPSFIESTDNANRFTKKKKKRSILKISETKQNVIKCTEDTNGVSKKKRRKRRKRNKTSDTSVQVNSSIKK